MTQEYFYTPDKGFSGYQNTKKTSICLGFFDGLHLGHTHIVDKALQESDNVSLLTFEGSIKYLLSKREENEVLTSVEDRKEILSAKGVKSLFVVDFTEDILNMDPVEFIKKILLPLNIDTIYIGSDFRFGKAAKGNPDLLRQYFKVVEVDFIYAYDKVKISSTLIIDLIHKGEIEKANKLLGREYYINGEVIHGLGNGRKLGFPTSNIKPITNYVIPKKGVYATLISVQGGKELLSMTDIGVHPTIDELNKLSIETNIISKDEDIYGKKIKLSFLSFIRDEQKFASVNKLVEQLTKDREAILAKYYIA